MSVRTLAENQAVKTLTFTTDLSRYNISSVCLRIVVLCAWVCVCVCVCESEFFLVTFHSGSIHCFSCNFFKWLTESSMRWRTRQRQWMDGSERDRGMGSQRTQKHLIWTLTKSRSLYVFSLFLCLILFCFEYSHSCSAKNNYNPFRKSWFVSCIIAIKSGVESFSLEEHSHTHQANAETEAKGKNVARNFNWSGNRRHWTHKMQWMSIDEDWRQRRLKYR